MSILTSNIIIPSLNSLQFSNPEQGNQFLHYPSTLGYVQKFAPTDSIHIQVRSDSPYMFAMVIENQTGRNLGTLGLNFTRTEFGAGYYVFNLVIPTYLIGYGQYYIQLSETGTVGDYISDSWPFEIGDFDDTILFTYFNETNDFETIFGDFSASTVFQFRVEGGFIPASTKDVSELSTFSDQLKQSSLTYGMPSFTKTLRIGDSDGLPDWVFEKLIAIGACDVLLIDGMQWVKAYTWDSEQTDKKTLILSADMAYTTNRMTQTVDGVLRLVDNFGNAITNQDEITLTI